MSNMNLNTQISKERAKGFFRRNKRAITYTAVAVTAVTVVGVGYYYVKKHRLDEGMGDAIANTSNTSS